jgi:phenylacetic acid degradation operon negative regulatory protein
MHDQSPNVSSPISDRIDAFCRQRRVQASSLIVTIFGDAVLPRGGRVWLGSLIQLLEPMQLNERLVRTSVFRLVKDGWLSAETVGRRANYALTPWGRRRFEEAASQIYAAHAPVWDKRWRMMLVVGELNTRQKEQLRRTLFWKGFGLIGSNCFIHPGVQLGEVIDALSAEGLQALLPQLVPMMAEDFQSAHAASDADLVTRAWDLSALGQSYAEFVAMYSPILAHAQVVSVTDDEQAFLLRMLLIHDYRRLLLRDPELPDALLPRDWSGRQARVLCKELYKQIEAASERYLDKTLCLADGAHLQLYPSLGARFVEAYLSPLIKT